MASDYDNMMEAARSHMQAHPEVFQPIKKKKQDRRQYSDADVEGMVLNLVDTFPELGNRALATLLNISRRYVRDIRALQQGVQEAYDDEQEDRDARASNIAGCQAFVDAMNLHHPGRVYEEDPRAKFEDRGFTVVAVETEAPRKADQSHTRPRKITLPTSPFKYAA